MYKNMRLYWKLQKYITVHVILSFSLPYWQLRLSIGLLSEDKIRGKLLKSPSRFLKITNFPSYLTNYKKYCLVSHDKLLSCCIVAATKLDRICLTLSNSNYNGPPWSFIACETLQRCKSRLPWAKKKRGHFGPL